MSLPETPVKTDIELLIESNARVEVALAKQTEALNAFGANFQWAIDQAKGIFQMFGDPAMMSMLPQMMNGTPDNG